MGQGAEVLLVIVSFFLLVLVVTAIDLAFF